MTKDITLNISDKFSVNIKFKDELRLLDICSVRNLVNANITGNLFELDKLSDEDLISYYDECLNSNYVEFATNFGREYFSLVDLDYDYMQQGNMLRVSGKLTYKSHDNFFGGNGKFSIDFYVVFTLPEDLTGKLEVYSCLLTITAGGNKTWTKALDSLIDDVSLTDGDNNLYGYNPVQSNNVQNTSRYHNSNKNLKLNNMP